MHEHHHEHNHKKIGWTILLNIFITLAEYIGGIFSGSLALISDAGHNFSDVLSLALGYFGEKYSHKAPNKKYSFGFKRIEIFTALINALILWAVGAYIIIEALNRINSAEHIALGIMLIAAIVGLAGNLISIIILNKDKESSLNMKAAYMHLFYDTVSSVAVIISAIIIYFTGFLILDTIVSIFIALMIFWSGYEIVRKTVHIFMQGVPENINIEEVHSKIGKMKGICTIHDLHIWNLDSNEIFLSCHICSNKKIKNDVLIRDIRNMLKSEYDITHTAIQTESEEFCNVNYGCYIK